MLKFDENYIDGAWVKSRGARRHDLINPAIESKIGEVWMGDALDADAAVAAARRALPTYSRWTVQDRAALLDRIAQCMEARAEALARAVSEEMGCPAWLAESAQIPLAIAHVRIAAEHARTFEFNRPMGSTMVRMVPIGVCALITPWNFPVSTITCKVAPALAVGCTMVLKPSEFSPISARLFAEILHEAGAPEGVFNLVFGDGETVGTAISSHPDVDMVSITGSTRAGVAVAQAAAPTIKRVHQELGGKSANVILPSADIKAAVTRGVKMLMINGGQGCSLPSRMLVPKAQMDLVREAVAEVAEAIQPSAPGGKGYIGPVVNASQFSRIQALIEKGVAEGATALIGGPGRPDGLETGFYVQPTVFADTTPDMTIVREEIFGPVLVLQAYDDVDEAIALANDTDYGLAAYVEAGDLEEAISVADRLVAGQVIVNSAAPDLAAPFGGVKHSGNGREYGPYGLEAFVEVKSIIGFDPEAAASSPLTIHA
ncbi:MAG: aldehyde dehydrogenase family protein [Candidatus Brevundimonas colombiensis]|uniref:Aldehyde dehydrogenase family protein n=1 Tax=Candidatus Brevundimonas colombiensis TaxID=3121376 RepID=A0AAJ5X2L0_9CAUL|nr:aldehyde dehydrogenase family protein [Brevundimonas sp.]WEK41476.1 MAG: aldehyde dehydrogenase family protein [Brevundimonas sp.]